MVSIIAGNAFAMTASWASLLISAILTSVIIAYDFRLKRSTVANPISMGLARFLNIVLGGSPALGHEWYLLKALYVVGLHWLLSIYLYYGD